MIALMNNAKERLVVVGREGREGKRPFFVRMTLPVGEVVTTPPTYNNTSVVNAVIGEL